MSKQFDWKSGWHPKGKEGGKESWRGDFKGINQVAGWMGKGKTPGQGDAATEHVSRPLATLKDPSAFGPPPKNVNYHGGAALPNEITPHRSGLGAPLSRDEIQSAHQAVHQPTPEQIEEQEKPAGPPLPYRADRTGLKTDHLPPPPVHRDIASPSNGTSIQQPPKPKPGLPPRLPSRQNTPTSPMVAAVSPPPPTYEAVTPTNTSTPSLNQSAINRLGNAGVSVSAFGIGKSNSESNPWKNEHSQTTSPPPPTTNFNQFAGIQSRLTRRSSSSNTATAQSSISPQPTATMQPPTTASTAPPTWQQSQSAFQTAHKLQTNPQSVSLADAQSAAATAQSAQRSASAFRERHADSISTAQTKAKAWDQRYKVTSRINKFLDEHTDESTTATPPPHSPGTAAIPSSSQTQLHEQQQAATPIAPSGYQPHQPPTPYQPHPTPTPYQSPTTIPHVRPQTSTPALTQPLQPLQPQKSPELAASITRKPPPPPPPKKPAKMQAPPPVPVGTKPSFA